jgi:hypothetical protein
MLLIHKKDFIFSQNKSKNGFIINNNIVMQKIVREEPHKGINKVDNNEIKREEIKINLMNKKT